MTEESPELKTSEEWQKLHPYPIVYDPDGWDRKNWQYSWYEEKISLEEYERRTFSSTCIHKVSNIKNQQL